MTSLLVAAMLMAPHPQPLSPGRERGAQGGTAADFFPLVPGTRRIYEQKDPRVKGVVTLVDEVGDKPALFDDKPATAIAQKSQFNQVLSTQYYRVDGPTVFLVGAVEERVVGGIQSGGTIDVTKTPTKKSVLMTLIPAIPVFKYEGKETTWNYGEIQSMRGAGDDHPIRTDETAIKGIAKPAGTRTVLGRKVETIEVKADVQLGSGELAQKILETSIYGKGIGLIESTRKTSGGGSKPTETRMRLVGLEEPKAGG